MPLFMEPDAWGILKETAARAKICLIIRAKFQGENYMLEYEPARADENVWVGEGRSGQRRMLLTEGETGGEILLEGEPEAFAIPSAVSRVKAAPQRANRRIVDGLPLDRIIQGDCFDLIRELPDESVHLVVTSPPYFQQRDYGAGMGGEKDIADYLENLLTLFRECLRVTALDGSIVFNLGDKYIDSSLALVPYRFAIAVTERFPVKLVNAITWVKRNPTPRQFQRRLVSSAEPFFHFVKSSDYFYNINAFQQADADDLTANRPTAKLGQRYYQLIAQSKMTDAQKEMARTALAQVIREVQCGEIAGFRMKIRGLHSEPFGGQEGGRKIQLDKNGFTVIRILGNRIKRDVIETPVESVKGCKHPAIYPVQIVEELLRLLTVPGDVVLDPFLGSGSTAVACKRLDRRFIGYELNAEYCADARKRLADTQEDFSERTV